ncbi:MAG: orotidine-5'-phosphate decarboxylase [Anaerolineae bacterium]
MAFIEKLLKAVHRNDSLLCVGLDPDPERIGLPLDQTADTVLAHNKAVIEATADLVCAYKPNFAFYEALGLAGLTALQQTIDYIPAEIPVILDGKRGDVEHTARAYARAAFEVWGADAVTVNPYLGSDAVLPFLAYKDKGVFLVCRTSNPGARDFQDLDCAGEALYQKVAQQALRWAETGNIGLVMGATYPEEMQAIRQQAPDLWFLVPGVGAQGADLEQAVRAGLNSQGQGIIVSVSRSIIYASDPRGEARRLREAINRCRYSMAGSQLGSEKRDLAKEELILSLHAISAIQYGQFTLHSGQTSPIYLDLRLLVSHPPTLRQAARQYANLLKGLSFDRLAAIPYAALPIATAVALEVGCPLVYTRKMVKEYGTKRPIEGTYRAGETVVLIDDLITTGASKLEAIAPLEAAGLRVRDVVVLIDRNQGGREELQERDYRLHSVMGMEELLEVLWQRGKMSSAQRDEVRNYLAASRGA